MRYVFQVTTESTDRLDLRGLCERHIADLWIPDHLTPVEAREYVLEHFKGVVLGDLEMLVVDCRRENSK